jgi:hypothetical protein
MMALVMTKSNLLDIHANNMGNEERVTITQTEHSSYIYINGGKESYS